LAAPHLELWSSKHFPWLSAAGRRFMVAGSPTRSREPYFWERWLERLWPNLFGADLPGALVMESSTGRELFRVVHRSQLGWGQLSEDGSTLMTQEWLDQGRDVCAFHFWDISPRRAYVGRSPRQPWGCWCWSHCRARFARGAAARDLDSCPLGQRTG
jgi:hypothetical protein